LNTHAHTICIYIKSGPDYGCPETCENRDLFIAATYSRECVDEEPLSELFSEYLDEVTRISSNWPSYWRDLWLSTALPAFSSSSMGCSAINNFQDGMSLDFCEYGGTVWPIKPLTYICPQSCGCQADDTLWGCPKTCNYSNDDDDDASGGGMPDDRFSHSFSFAYLSFDTSM